MGEYENTSLYAKTFLAMWPDYGILWSVLESLQPGKIVELGCGNGRLLPLWLDSGATEIVGIDIEEKMISEFLECRDHRVSAKVGDIRRYIPAIENADLVVLASSLLKHLKPENRVLALSAIAKSIEEGCCVYIDHCSHVYGVERSTDWQTYYETLRNWWPEEFRSQLKKLSWKKEVNQESDILLYRDDQNGEESRVTTFVYAVADLESDITNAGFEYQLITKEFPSPYGLKGMPRFIALLHLPSPIDTWEERIATIVELAFETSHP